MSNTWFQFKQFKINQEHCAMKVTTDACLFGAWVVSKAIARELPVQHVLDIGSGTGLLTLMLAQKLPAMIDSIEIDDAAFMQACENVNETPWKQRIHMIQADVKTFQFNKLYDLVISNPPFYENNLRSPENNRNVAMHEDALKLDDLLNVAASLMKDNGLLAVLLPYPRMESFVANAKGYSLVLKRRLALRPTRKHAATRSFLLLQKDPNELTPGKKSIGSRSHDDLPAFEGTDSKIFGKEVDATDKHREEKTKIIEEEFIIKEIHHKYSSDFINLLQDYYLSL